MYAFLSLNFNMDGPNPTENISTLTLFNLSYIKMTKFMYKNYNCKYKNKPKNIF